MEKQRQERYRNEVKNTLITADLGISKQLDKSLMATYALAAVVAEWNGSVSNFDNIGSRLMENFKGISALELAPDGNITYIYPLEGNEAALGINITSHPLQGPNARRSIETRQLTLYGPITLTQGGVAVLGRYPIFLDGPTPGKRDIYWGFAIVLIKFSELFDEIGLDAILSDFHWELYNNEDGQLIAKSQDSQQLDNPVVDIIHVPNGNWTLKLSPLHGWPISEAVIVESILFGLAIFVAVSFVGWVTHQIIQDYYRKKEYAFQNEILENKVKERTAELDKLLQRIAEEEENTRTIMNAVADSVITVDDKGTIIHCNSTFLKTFHYDKNSKINVSEIFPSFEKDFFKKSAGGDTEAQLKGGTKIPVRVTVTHCVLNTKDKKLNVHVLVVHDQTERHVLLSKLEKGQKKLDQLRTQVEFDKCFQDPTKRQEFKKFCEKEFSAENISFLEEIDQYKHINDVKQRVEKAKHICDTYLKVGAKQELNISRDVVEREIQHISKGLGQRDLFDNLESSIRLLIQDTFRRFISPEKKDSQT